MAILLLARTTVEKIQILVVLVTHIVAVAWVGAIVVPKEIAVELIVLRPLRQLLRQPFLSNSQNCGNPNTPGGSGRYCCSGADCGGNSCPATASPTSAP